MEYPFIYPISTVDHSAEQPGQRVDCLSLGDEGGYLRGDQLGGGDGGEGLHVAEGDPELLGEGLGDDGVPRDGGGHHGVGGQQAAQSQGWHRILMLRLLLWLLLQLWLLLLETSELTQTSESGSETSEAATVDGLGGGDVVSLGGDAVGVGDGGEDLAVAEVELDNTCLYHRLSLVHWRCLSDHLAEKLNYFNTFN